MYATEESDPCNETKGRYMQHFVCTHVAPCDKKLKNKKNGERESRVIE
jgi:hypothetical protein